MQELLQCLRSITHLLGMPGPNPHITLPNPPLGRNCDRMECHHCGWQQRCKYDLLFHVHCVMWNHAAQVIAVDVMDIMGWEKWENLHMQGGGRG